MQPSVEPESKLDLNVLDGDNSEAIKNLAATGITGCGYDAILTKLGIYWIWKTRQVEEIKAAYESYYENVSID